MKNIQTGLRILNSRRDVTLMAATAVWKAGSEAESRFTAVVAGVIIGVKAGATFKNQCALAIGAAAGAVVAFVAHITAHTQLHQPQVAA